MTDFTEITLKDKLSKLTNHQTSILSISAWLQQNHSNRETIIRVWLKTIRKEIKPAKVVNLLYLANDVAQNTRKSCPAFKEDFFPAVENAFRHVIAIKGPDVEKAMMKLVQVWKERGIYNATQIKRLKDALSQKKMSASFPTPAGKESVKGGQKSHRYIEEEVKKNAQDVLKLLKRLQNPPSTERDIRVRLSQYPDTISCPEKLSTIKNSEEAQELLALNEEALPLLEDYVKRLKEETKERDSLQEDFELLIQNVRLSIEHQDHFLKEVKRKEDKLKASLLEVEKAYESLPDLDAEMAGMSTELPSFQNLFGL